jgi:hypothetical protein
MRRARALSWRVNGCSETRLARRGSASHRGGGLRRLWLERLRTRPRHVGRARRLLLWWRRPGSTIGRRGIHGRLKPACQCGPPPPHGPRASTAAPTRQHVAARDYAVAAVTRCILFINSSIVFATVPSTSESHSGALKGWSPASKTRIAGYFVTRKHFLLAPKQLPTMASRSAVGVHLTLTQRRRSWLRVARVRGP